MSNKFFRATITFDIYPDENGTFDWEDEDATPRTEDQLIDFARSELAEAIYNGLKYDELYNMIDVEIVGG
jgi:hypothetical protein